LLDPNFQPKAIAQSEPGKAPQRTIQIGDLLDIKLQFGTSKEQTVAILTHAGKKNGNVKLTFMGEAELEGKTLVEAEAQIFELATARRYFKNPPTVLARFADEIRAEPSSSLPDGKDAKTPDHSDPQSRD
jgi:protein involved in polysaccharide export with SLBB domain